jgi:hypothetical protein
MPLYFFHTCTQDRLIWDATGLDLPEISGREVSDLTLALWSEVFDRQFRRGRAFVIMDAAGKVVFATSF